MVKEAEKYLHLNEKDKKRDYDNRDEEDKAPKSGGKKAAR